MDEQTPRRYGIQYSVSDTNGKTSTKTISGVNLVDDSYVPSSGTVEQYRQQQVADFVKALTAMSTDTLLTATLIRYEEVSLLDG